MSTQGLIVASVVVTAGTTFVAQSKSGNIQFRSYLAASFVGIILSGMAMVNEQLARNFALLVMVVALLRNGAATTSFISQSTSKVKG
jgi:hypothetical protein